MGLSLFLVLEAKMNSKRNALVFFFVQLTLNFFWSIIFFKEHEVALALADIAALWLCILMMIVTFYKISRIAGLLQIPYLLWVSFATLLNASILHLN
jgi:tryptophan-rich sensory protein